MFIRASAAADGHIVELRRKPGSSRISLAPTFRFTAQNGVSYTVMSNIYEKPPTYVPGGSVPVLYPPDQPASARIDSFWQLWMPQFVLGVVGAGFSFIPLAVVLRRRRAT